MLKKSFSFSLSFSHSHKYTPCPLDSNQTLLAFYKKKIRLKGSHNISSSVQCDHPVKQKSRRESTLSLAVMHQETLPAHEIRSRDKRPPMSVFVFHYTTIISDKAVRMWGIDNSFIFCCRRSCLSRKRKPVPPMRIHGALCCLSTSGTLSADRPSPAG